MEEIKESSTLEEITPEEILSPEIAGDPQPDEYFTNEETVASEAAFPESIIVDEIAQWKDAALRAQAELENFRKRAAREKMDAIKFANARLLGDLLPVLDNFDMGLAAARSEDSKSPLAMGMEMVFKQIEEFLSSNGVTEIATTGPFDPNQHEAVQQEPDGETPENHIIRPLRKGYRLHDRLLRAASVVVSTGPTSSETPATTD